jgi:hypothetical protein
MSWATSLSPGSDQGNKFVAQLALIQYKQGNKFVAQLALIQYKQGNKFVAHLVPN